MATDHSGSRWPFATDGRPLTGRPYEPTTECAASAFVSAVAETSDTDPLALPTLNDRIDPDFVDPLVAETPPDQPAGVRVAVEVSLGEVAVLLCDDRRVEVYLDEREPNRLEPAAAGEHDWSNADPLLWSIGRVVATVSDKQPTDVTTRLAESLDADALNRLLRPHVSGSERHDSRLLVSVDGYEVTVGPDGSIAVEPSLAVLKRSGAALLVVGSIPEQGFDRAAATLLGDPDEARHPVFVLHGRGLETAQRRLSMADMPPAAGTVLDHRTTARGASATTTARIQSNDQEPEVVPVTGGIRALPEAIRETIENTRAVSPGELRICVDSLRSMVDSSGLETTRDALTSICRVVREHQGIGTFLFPIEADSEAVETLAPSFDAVVAVRTGEAGVEQQWRLTTTGHETPWFPLG